MVGIHLRLQLFATLSATLLLLLRLQQQKLLNKLQRQQQQQNFKPTKNRVEQHVLQIRCR